jgi:hypothetical protein
MLKCKMAANGSYLDRGSMLTFFSDQLAYVRWKRVPSSIIFDLSYNVVVNFSEELWYPIFNLLT